MSAHGMSKKKEELSYLVPYSWISRAFRDRLVIIQAKVKESVIAEARKLPGVSGAWIASDGLSFTFVGPVWTTELSSSAVRLGMRLQRKIVPGREVQIDGCFREVGGNMRGSKLVFARLKGPTARERKKAQKR